MDTKKIAISLNLELPYERYHDFYKGVQEYADKFTGWELVWDHFPELKLRSTDKPYYDGVIGRIKFAAYEEITRHGIPHVNSWYGSEIKDIPSVFPDMEHAGRIAAQHLIERGFRSIVNIDNKNDKASDAFFEGVMSVLSTYKVPRKRYLVTREVSVDSEFWLKFNDDIDKWCNEWEPPLAVCCSMSHLGFKISRRIIESSFRIPDDIALVCGFNEHAFCESHSPLISSVDMDMEKNGYEAARLLDRQFKGEILEEKIIFVPPVGLIARESTDTFAIEDKNVKMAMRFIADNINSNINVSDVVDSVSISRRTLELRFNNIIGYTIIDEINRLRITSMKRLLIESDSNLNKLYMQTGFSSSKHMRRTFKRYTGMTPSEYRESVNKK
jgi:LacI family transcriptional regulator